MAAKKELNEKESPKEACFREVEKEFYQSQITDLNRRNARLKTLIEELQTKIGNSQKAYNKLDVDRADIIAYLNKNIKLKTEECEELREKVKLLEGLRQKESIEFKLSLAESDKHFKFMKDRLTSENKLLSSKINTLEEFRMQKEILMNKFEIQEQLMKDQDMKYKRIIYDTEKKLTIDKDKLKKEMEARLLQLAQNFQDATEIRIAASTHRVIRENIAINNELNDIMCYQSKLSVKSEQYKQMKEAAIISKEVAEEERDDVIQKNFIQQKLINKLTTVIQNLKDELASKQNICEELQSAEDEKELLLKNNVYLNMRVHELEEQFIKKIENHNQSYANISKIMTDNLKLKQILSEAVAAVGAIHKIDYWFTDSALKSSKLQNIFDDLLKILSKRYYLDQISIDYAEKNLNSSKIKSGNYGTESESKSDLRPCHETFDHKEGSVETEATSSTFDTSITTYPSLKIIPALSKEDLKIEDSLPSFYRSFHSSDITEETIIDVDKDNTEGMSDMQKLLLQSKLEIKKYLMLDLTQAGYSKSLIRITESAITEPPSSVSEKSNDEISKISDKDIQEQTDIEENISGDIEIEREIHDLELEEKQTENITE